VAIAIWASSRLAPKKSVVRPASHQIATAAEQRGLARAAADG